jgi:hypothetical protein
MPLNLRNEAVSKRAEKLAARKGINQTEAVKLALENELRRMDRALPLRGAAASPPGPCISPSGDGVGRGQGLLLTNSARARHYFDLAVGLGDQHRVRDAQEQTVVHHAGDFQQPSADAAGIEPPVNVAVDDQIVVV